MLIGATDELAAAIAQARNRFTGSALKTRLEVTHT
jgi:hypothetical protein